MRAPCLILILQVLINSGFCSTALAQTATRHSLSLDVKTVATGGDSSVDSERDKDEKPKAGAGGDKKSTRLTQTREKESSLGLQVEVRNLGQKEDQAKLEWYFFAKPVAGGELYVFDSGQKEVTVLAAGAIKEVVRSHALEVKTERELTVRPGKGGKNAKAPTGATTKTGATVGGWIVRVTANGQPLAVKASSPALESMGADPKKLGTYATAPKK